MKKIVYTIVLLFIFLVSNLFGPYNMFQDINADAILKDVQLKMHFTTNPVQSADYLGNGTYLIVTSEGTEYVARQEYFSMMNYKWKIYKQDRGDRNE
ncbi:hypothetical protein [Bacillus sp. AK031]